MYTYHNQMPGFIPLVGINTSIFQMYPASYQLISDEDLSPVNGDPESGVV
jgi:hypothetical protein